MLKPIEVNLEPTEHNFKSEKTSMIWFFLAYTLLLIKNTSMNHDHFKHAMTSSKDSENISSKCFIDYII